MEHKSYLTFSLNGLYYGVDALLVQEIFPLPELTPIAEAPDDIVGILNLRSKILPVMHLALRLKQQLQRCRLSDSVIVLKWEELQIGMIVNQVHEVQNIHPEAIEEQISYGRETEANSRFVTGVAKVNGNMIMLLSHEKLLRCSDTVEPLLPDATNGRAKEFTNGHASAHNGLGHQFSEHYQSAISKINSFYVLCCPQATSEERATFRERAENLSRPIESSDFTGLMPLAVIGLNDEYFGLDLESVREFTNIRNFTPIPCCPPHIVGNMNLRGEIVTLVDIRSVLNMPLAVASTASKAIVIHADDIVAGLPVDEVFDVIYLRLSDMLPVPVAVRSNTDEYLRGTAPYFDKMLSILDLPKILTNGGLAVNEEL